MMMCSASNRSSLELMLDSIRQRDEQSTDAPPALPVRPVSKARLPQARRALPVNFKKSGIGEDPKENEARKKEDRESSFKLGVFESKRMKRETFVVSPDKQRSVEGDDVTACVSMSRECECGNNVGFGLKKIEIMDVMDGTRERALEGILEIQKYFRGHQARCYYLELKRGIITLQSFVHGEKARKDYRVLTRKLAAVIVIQQHTKKWIGRRAMQRRQRAVICLQSVIRGWLTRRCLNYKGKFRLPGIEPTKDISNPEKKDHIHGSHSALADLQRRLLRVETELGGKEEENAALRHQLQQFDRKWAQYEAKMKSMEKIWQDQLTSLQMGLAAAKKSFTSECNTHQPGTFDPFPLYRAYGADDTMSMETQAADGRSAVDFSNLLCDTEPQQTNRLTDIDLLSEQHKKVFHDKANIVGELKSVHLASSMSPENELQKLKLRFVAWKKDYKIRLLETKAMLQKVGHSETKKSHKKWWGRRMQKGALNFDLF